jgi:hypothetical protein
MNERPMRLNFLKLKLTHMLSDFLEVGDQQQVPVILRAIANDPEELV